MDKQGMEIPVHIAVRAIVSNAIDAKMELKGGELGSHVGAAYGAYCTYWQLSQYHERAIAIKEDLHFLGFNW